MNKGINEVIAKEKDRFELARKAKVVLKSFLVSYLVICAIVTTVVTKKHKNQIHNLTLKLNEQTILVDSQQKAINTLKQENDLITTFVQKQVGANRRQMKFNEEVVKKFLIIDRRLR